MLDKLKSSKLKAILAMGAGTVALASAISLSGCASCSRNFKSFESNVNGGMWRKIDVYSDGELIAEYVGFFDIDVDESGRIMFDDENGERHQVGGGDTGYVIDELEESEAKELQKDGKVKVYEKSLG